jgi:hypothetical protein
MRTTLIRRKAIKVPPKKIQMELEKTPTG